MSDVIGRPRRVDDLDPAGFFGGNQTEGEIDFLVIASWSPTDTVEFFIVPGASTSTAFSQGQHQRSIGKIVPNPKCIDGSHSLDAELARTTLIGERRIDEAVSKDPLAFFERRTNRFRNMFWIEFFAILAFSVYWFTKTLEYYLLLGISWIAPDDPKLASRTKG